MSAIKLNRSISYAKSAKKCTNKIKKNNDPQIKQTREQSNQTRARVAQCSLLPLDMKKKVY